MNTLEFAVLIMVLLIIGIALGQFVTHPTSYNEGYATAIVDIPDCICELDCDCEEQAPCICSMSCPNEESQLERIVRDVAEEVEYGGEVSQQVCRHKASELVRRLKTAGYKNVEVIQGWLWFEDEWAAHDWVCFVNKPGGDCLIAIESTTGSILSPDYYTVKYSEGR